MSDLCFESNKKNDSTQEFSQDGSGLLWTDVEYPLEVEGEIM
jgi:hypothetical protein